MSRQSFLHVLRSRLFLGLSLFIAASNGLFVWINHYSHKAHVQKFLEQRVLHLNQLFDGQVDDAGLRMQQIASYIAALPQTQDLLETGIQAAKAQGPDAAAAREARTRLLENLAAPWERLRDRYDTRQLHFQYGEHATSFLRVHAPQKYGDDLETVRHTILTALRTQQPLHGFECGRVVCGIRGVVPLFKGGIEDPGHFIGVLEAGTSFQNSLAQMERVSNTHFAVLLQDTYLRQTHWPEPYERLTRSGKYVAPYFIEGTLHEPEARALMTRIDLKTLASQGGVTQNNLNGQPVAVMVFPLRDFLGQREPHRANAGYVLAWFDISDAIQEERENLLFNIAYAVLAFLLLEGLLLISFRLATQHLEKRIEAQTRALHDMAVHDPLTGLYNRHHLNDFLEKEIQRARRAGRPMSIAIMDLDHFKAINDDHGHMVGDAVLVDTAKHLLDRLRSSDLVFRYGGEEFLILFTESGIQQASGVCNELRAQLAASSVGGLPRGRVTASFGVTDIRLRANEPIEDFIKRADTALYRAKHNGRNRVETEQGTSH